jgi:hemolysin activation/secretion protein
MRIVAKLAVLSCSLSSSALAQFGVPLPSQVVPQERRPPADADTAPVVRLPAVPPPRDVGAASLHVTLSAVEVAGGFDDVAQSGDPFAAIVGRSVDLREIQQAVDALQTAYDAAGYALVRIVMPPQTLRDGGTMKLRVVDGYIESIQAEGVPEPVRAAVRARLASLVGQRRLRWSQLERQVLLAGDLPGLRLGSALLPGTAEDGVRLAVDGAFEAVDARVDMDNALPSSLGEHALDGNLVLNSPLRFGDQWLLSQTRGLGSAVHGRAPLNSTSVGVVLPVGATALTITPQAVRAQTAPADAPGAPVSTGVFERLSTTLGYAFILQRSGRLDGELGVDRISQSQRAVDFGVDLNRDDYHSMRLRARGESAVVPRHVVRMSVTAAMGLGGRTQARAQASGTPLSRAGASPRFRKFGIEASDDWAIGDRWSLRTRALAQASFGRPLLRPELLPLDGADGVSAFRPGELAFDQGMLARVELQRLGEAEVPGGRWMWRPYTFAAAGRGSLFRATALEPAHESARAVGLGWRSDSHDMTGHAQLHLEFEGARGWSNWPRPEVRMAWLALAAWHF